MKDKLTYLLNTKNVSKLFVIGVEELETKTLSVKQEGKESIKIKREELFKFI